MAYDPLEHLAQVVGRAVDRNYREAEQDRQRGISQENIRLQEEANNRSSDRASNRRMGEVKESERLALFREYAKMNYPVTVDMSVDEMNKVALQARRAGARNELDIKAIEVQAAATDVQRLRDELFTIIGNTEGAPEHQRTALQAALTNTPNIPTKVKNSLLATLSDPKRSASSAVKQAVEEIRNDYWKFIGWVPGVRGKGDAEKEALAFADAYTTALSPLVDAEAKSKLAVWHENYRGAVKRNTEVLDSAYKTLQDLNSANLLDGKEWKDWTARLGPPDDVTKVIAGKKKTSAPEPAKVTIGTPAPTTQAPPAPAPQVSTFTPPPVSQTYEEKGIVGAAKQIAGERFQDPAVSTPILAPKMAMLAPAAAAYILSKPAQSAESWKTALFGTGANDNSQPITKLEALENRAIVNARTRPGSTTMPADVTPDEIKQMEQIARSYGMDDERIAKANALIEAGDPTAIAQANQLLSIVRKSRLAKPLSVPANAPILSAR